MTRLVELLTFAAMVAIAVLSVITIQNPLIWDNEPEEPTPVPATRVVQYTPLLPVIGEPLALPVPPAPAQWISECGTEMDLSWQGITDERLREMVASGEIPTHVIRLRLAGNQISDVTPLAYLIYLESLDLWGNYVMDVSPLAALTGLVELDLWGNNFADISSLYTLTNLRTLSMCAGWDFSGDISVFRYFSDLTELGLSGGNISSNGFAYIAYLENLERFQLWGGSRFNSLSVFSNAENMTHLTLNGISISDLSPLSNFTGLVSLDLQHSRIVDISAIDFGNLTNLTILYLWGNYIIDISPLSGLYNLVYLGLRGNRIVDVSPINGLTTLSWLAIDDNNITDISSLEGLVGLNRLEMGGNPIAAEQIRNLRDALPWLYQIYYD